MKRRILRLGVSLSATVLVAIGLAAPGAANAVTTVITKPGAVLQLVTAGTAQDPEPTFDDSGFTFSAADTTRGILARSDDVFDQQFTVEPPTGQALAAGMYVYNGDEQPIVPLATAGPDAQGSLLDILDVASSPSDGTITRFDAVIEGVGEFRFGENESASPVEVGARHLLFGKAFVGSPQVLSPETLHNTGTVPVTVGTPTMSGHARGSYAVSHSTCGTVLAAGASCGFDVGFSPTTAGPENAQLSIPLGSSAQVVDLVGSAYLGTSSITVSGKDIVDKGRTTKAVAGKDAFVQETGAGYDFDASDATSGNEIAGVFLDAPNYGPIPVGSRPTGFILNRTGYGVRATVDSEACDTTGSEDVKAFRVDAAKVATMADVSFSQRCNNDPNLQTGTLLWQYRADVTAPNAPTALRIVGSRATWKASTSTDTSTVVARLVEGNGAGSTPESGTALTTSGNTATLPTVPASEQYAVVLFDVDKSGNVIPGIAARFGTAPKVVTAPGPATAVSAVAGPNGAATVTFVAPRNTGGLPITHYVVQPLGGEGPSLTTTSTTADLTGLSVGGRYEYIVFAYNAAGRGQQSLVTGTIIGT